jgi:hypothetical protein
MPALVRRALRVAGAVAAVGLLGYAVVSLSGEPSSSSGKNERAKRVTASETRARDEDGKRSEAGDKAARKPVVRKPPVTGPPPLAADAAADGGDPPSYEQSRRELEQLVDEVEDMAGRGDHLPQEQWIELYKRGDILNVAVARGGADTSEADRTANGKLNQRFRVAVMKVQPAPRAK